MGKPSDPEPARGKLVERANLAEVPLAETSGFWEKGVP
jgi:hypothetical protein